MAIDLAWVPHNPLHFNAAGQSPVFAVLLSCDRPQEYCRVAGWQDLGPLKWRWVFTASDPFQVRYAGGTPVQTST
jgi:hypothetical protein